MIGMKLIVHSLRLYCKRKKEELFMKKRVIALCMAAVMSIGLVGCGKSSNVDESKGKVVVYMPSPSNLNQEIMEGFTAKTGIEVELFEGTTGEILARLETEKSNPIADVVVLASWADGLGLKEDDQLLEYVPANADKLYDGWSDEDNMLYGTSASALGVIYNTTILPELSADWSELASGEYNDLLAFPDAEKSGSAKDFLSGYINAFGEESWSVWEALADNGMTVPGANKAALEAVTTGEKAILVAGVDYNAYTSMAAGEPLDIYYPEGGTLINPRPAMILKTSKNVDNAKLFMDYLLSDEAQEMVADAYLLPGRSDIQCDNRTNVSDIVTFDVDWNWIVGNSNSIASKMNELCR